MRRTWCTTDSGLKASSRHIGAPTFWSSGSALAWGGSSLHAWSMSSSLSTGSRRTLWSSRPSTWQRLRQRRCCHSVYLGRLRFRLWILSLLTGCQACASQGRAFYNTTRPWSLASLAAMGSCLLGWYQWACRLLLTSGFHVVAGTHRYNRQHRWTEFCYIVSLAPSALLMSAPSWFQAALTAAMWSTRIF